MNYYEYIKTNLQGVPCAYMELGKGALLVYAQPTHHQQMEGGVSYYLDDIKENGAGHAATFEGKLSLASIVEVGDDYAVIEIDSRGEQWLEIRASLPKQRSKPDRYYGEEEQLVFYARGAAKLRRVVPLSTLIIHEYSRESVEEAVGRMRAEIKEQMRAV